MTRQGQARECGRHLEVKLFRQSLREEPSEEPQLHLMRKRLFQASARGRSYPEQHITHSRPVHVTWNTEQRADRGLFHLVRTQQRVEPAVSRMPSSVIRAGQASGWHFGVRDELRDIQRTFARLPEPPDPFVVFKRADSVLDALKLGSELPNSLEQVLRQARLALMSARGFSSDTRIGSSPKSCSASGAQCVRVSQGGGGVCQSGSTLPPRQSRSGRSRKLRRIVSIQSGATRTSSSKKATMSPRAASIPAFRAYETPCRGSMRPRIRPGVHAPAVPRRWRYRRSSCCRRR